MFLPQATSSLPSALSAFWRWLVFTTDSDTHILGVHKVLKTRARTEEVMQMAHRSQIVYTPEAICLKLLTDWPVNLEVVICRVLIIASGERDPLSPTSVINISQWDPKTHGGTGKILHVDGESNISSLSDSPQSPFRLLLLHCLDVYFLANKIHINECELTGERL